MMTTYVAKYGDWLAKIAEEHGTTVAAIWNHPENAEHRQKRGSPDVLYPGDVLRIDAAEPVTPPGQTPANPAEPAKPAPEPKEAPRWPYPPYEGPFSTKPTWECPGGTCECHPPPEDEPVDEHVIVFYDKHGVRMPGARCRVYEQGRLITPEPTSADGAGEVRVELRAGTSTVRVEWAPPDVPPRPFLPYNKTYHVKLSDDGDIALDRRLSNLGFFNGKRRRDNVADYQRAYTRPPTGNPDDIRLEVLERHDNGAVEPFHPQAPSGPTEAMSPQARSLFAAPAPRSGSAFQLVPDEQSGSGGGAGQTTASGQNVKGSAVPAHADVFLLVICVPDIGPIDPAKAIVKLRPRAVSGMTPEQAGRNIDPTVKPSAPSSPLSYEFKDIPVGIYDAFVAIDGVKNAQGRTTFAMGRTEVRVHQSWPSQGLVMAQVGHPITTVADPLMTLDIEPIQRRRKVLATVFSTFPQWAGGEAKAAAANHRPHYDQGPYKSMAGANSSFNTCSAICTMTNNLASAKENKLDPDPEKAKKEGPVPAGNGHLFGYNSKKHPSYQLYADGLVPSVGDSACYRGTDGKIHHCGLFLGFFEVSDPRTKTEVAAGRPAPPKQRFWISADGGQRTPTHPFQNDKDWGWSRRYDNLQNEEAAFILPRIFTTIPGQANVENSYIFPTRAGGGYIVDGWLDVADPSIPFPKPEYGKKGDAVPYGTEDDYNKIKAYLLNRFPGLVDADRLACYDIQTGATPRGP